MSAARKRRPADRTLDLPPVVADKGCLGTVRLPPEIVAKVAGRPAYVLLCDGDCMAPDVLHGDALVVVADEPLADRQLCVFWPAKGINGDKPALKRLTRVPPFGWPHHPESNLAASVEFEQQNPPRRYRVWADQLAGIHPVVARIPAAEYEAAIVPTRKPARRAAAGGRP